MKRTLKPLALAVLISLTACTRSMTFRVVDAQTHAPLAGINVLHGHGVFEMKYEADGATDANGIVTVNNIAPWDDLSINPPELGSIGLHMHGTPHWTGGRRDIALIRLAPVVTYCLAEDKKTYTASEKSGVVDIPIPDEGKLLKAEIERMLVADAHARLVGSQFERAISTLVQIDSDDALPYVRRACEKLTTDVAATVAATPQNQKPSLLALQPLYHISYFRAAFGEKQAALDNLRQLFVSCAPKLPPQQEADFKSMLDNAAKWTVGRPWDE